MDFKDYAKLMKQSRDSDPAQFDKDMAEDRRASERREKVAERYDRMLQRSAPDSAEESQPRLKRSASHLAAAEKAGLKLTEDIKPVAKPRPSGRAANADIEGGMKPGQSPSLENPLRQAKGGKVKAEGMAKGGMTAKGWGKARGARAAKVY